MPKISRKRGLRSEICLRAMENFLQSPTMNLSIIDEAVENIMAVSLSRNFIPRSLLPKSDEWITKILPSYSDEHFRHFMRVPREDFRKILRLVENHAVFHGPNCQKQLPVKNQIAITLFKFGFAGNSSVVITEKLRRLAQLQ